MFKLVFEDKIPQSYVVFSNAVIPMDVVFSYVIPMDVPYVL